MRYALLVYADQSEWAGLSETEAATARAEAMPQWLALFEELGNIDPTVRSLELEAAADARVVRVRDGETLVTDGPYAETKELIGGVFITELPDLDEAIRVAALVPATAHGSLEIRPIVQ